MEKREGFEPMKLYPAYSGMPCNVERHPDKKLIVPSRLL